MFERRQFRYLSRFLFAMCLALSAQAQSQTEIPTILFQKSFIRSPGKPESSTETYTFLVPSAVHGPFTLTLENGDRDGQNRISSATVTINGTAVIRPSDLNQNIATVDRQIELTTANTLSVGLRSAPGSFAKILIKGLLTWNVFKDTSLGITFDYPPQWYVQPTSDHAAINVSNVQEQSEESDAALDSESLIQIHRIQNANPDLLPADKWFDIYFANGFAVPLLLRSNIFLNGRPAVRIEVSEIGRRVHFYILNHSDVVEVSYGLFNPNFIPEYETILNTLQFDR